MKSYFNFSVCSRSKSERIAIISIVIPILLVLFLTLLYRIRSKYIEIKLVKNKASKLAIKEEKRKSLEFFILIGCYVGLSVMFLMHNMIYNIIILLCVFIIVLAIVLSMFNNDYKPGVLMIFALISLPTSVVYSIYIIQDTKLQNILTSTSSAILGGFLTLIGVAWTIKKSDNDKRSEAKQKAKPLFSFYICENPESLSKSCYSDDGLNKRFKINCVIENSNLSSFVMKSILIDGEESKIKGSMVVLPSDKILFNFSFCNKENIILVVEDCLQNIYYYQIILNNFNGLSPIFEIKDIKEIDEDSYAIIKRSDISGND